MSLLPPETSTTATEKAPTLDPKAGAAGAAGPDGSFKGDGSDTPGATAAGSSPSTETPKAQPSKAQQDFEKKLEELATLDLSVKERAKAIDIAKAKMDRFTPIDEHLSKKEYRAAVKALLGDAYTPDLLLELADDFAPEEISVEERVKRTMEAERKAADAAAAKKAEEKAAADKLAVETETKAYLSAAAEHLRKNKEKFPLICAWDDDPDVDHEAMIDKTWRAHYARTNEVPDPEKVLEEVEARHLARVKKTHLYPKEPAAPSLEETTGYSLPPQQLAARPPDRYRSGADEALDRLDAYDREQSVRAQLSYGR